MTGGAALPAAATLAAPLGDPGAGTAASAADAATAGDAEKAGSGGAAAAEGDVTAGTLVAAVGAVRSRPERRNPGRGRPDAPPDGGRDRSRGGNPQRRPGTWRPAATRAHFLDVSGRRLDQQGDVRRRGLGADLPLVFTGGAERARQPQSDGRRGDPAAGQLDGDGLERDLLMDGTSLSPPDRDSAARGSRRPRSPRAPREPIRPPPPSNDFVASCLEGGVPGSIAAARPREPARGRVAQRFRGREPASSHTRSAPRRGWRRPRSPRDASPSSSNVRARTGRGRSHLQVG
jgi:hypothetical protein